ncbi:hypothetical protein BKH41_08420 [Helicobacter sp. 12S02232-10]|uniref:hypothetical protein n=1 Tax=Helicobacter sp. 12S02232-10 TaxID=1476197 RepID=UPI000BA78833|nr:hypothetical protein [Helicobacter sp. 12S02232-10]PAF46883.1 hypothetical protein BKH41_08420 [Helicobacter sp. 12S02232-10]
MNLAMKDTQPVRQYTYDEILEAAESGEGVRVRLLKEGYNAIYYDETISDKYNLLLQPDGKCYFLDPNSKSMKNEILRELTPEEYAKLDLVKGRDY